MPPRCSICDHAEVAAIDRALVGSATLRDIAEKFGVSRDAVHRHRANGHVSKALAKAAEAADVARGDELLTRVRDLEDRALHILDRAERAGELRTALHAIRELRSMIALLFETERRRTMDQGISGQELTILLAELGDIILRHVPERERLALIADEIRGLLGSGIETMPRFGGDASNGAA